MYEQLLGALSDFSGDYGDIRYEENNHLTLSMFNGELKSSGMHDSRGGHVRVVSRGRKAAGSYSAPDKAAGTVKDLAEAADACTDLPAAFPGMADAAISVDEVIPSPEKHPSEVSLEDKIALIKNYSDLALSAPGITGVNAMYREVILRKWFVSTEGAKIFQEQTQVDVVLRIDARDGALVQNVALVLGGSPDYARLCGRHDSVEEKAALASKLLKAPPAEAGVFPVVLAPELTGVFIHEAFGHFSEADSLRSNHDMRKKMATGRRLGKECLTVIDDPSLKGHPGSYKYDDEGVLGERTVLIDRGVVSGRLHSRETALEFEDAPNGHARAVDHRYTPIVRMGNICVQEGEHSLEELISGIDDGYYASGPRGGQTMGDQFTLGSQYARRIRNGKLAELVRDASFSGNLFTTLMNVDAVGNDFFIPDAGGCGKDSQLLWRSGVGGPHIRISGLAVGGV